MTSDSTYRASKDDILALQPYVVRNENGTLTLNEVAARKNGVNEDVITSLQQRFTYLNNRVAKGEIYIDEELKIIESDKNTEHPANISLEAKKCGGGVNSYEEFWWGYRRKACDCEAQRIANDLNTAAAGGGVATGIATVISSIFGVGGIIAGLSGIDAGYWWLVATRIEANNEGSGVIIDMTYALVFDIEPQ